MKKLILLFGICILFACEKNENNDILPNIPVDIIIDLNLPQYIDLQVPTGWVYTNGGLQGIVVKKTGGTPAFKAFERTCPNRDCSQPMTYDGSLKLKCPCDDSQYSIIDGSPQTSGAIYSAREYRVIEVGSSTLNITNF